MRGNEECDDEIVMMLISCIPVSMDMVVVLPAPLCPSRAVMCPLYMLKLRLSTAFFAGLCLRDTKSKNRWKID